MNLLGRVRQALQPNGADDARGAFSGALAEKAGELAWAGRAGERGREATPRDAAPLSRHSNGLREFTAALREPGLAVLDLGHTSHANLSFLSQLGHKAYHEDLLLASADSRWLRPDAPLPAAEPKTASGGATEPPPAPLFDADAFLDANLRFAADSLDGLLMWDLPDYLPEPLVKPLVARLTAALRPNGVLLAYFHTRDAGPSAPFYRYNIQPSGEELSLRPSQSLPRPVVLARIFNNRNIENLFAGFRSRKFFLARDNLREVLATK